MTGAQVFARVCREEGLAALFCCPGNYNVVNAIAQEGVPTFGAGMKARCVMRPMPSPSYGRIAAASGTEGPGFTNMICAIATANARALAGARAREQYVDLHRRYGGRDPTRSSAACNRGDKEIRQAIDRSRKSA